MRTWTQREDLAKDGGAAYKVMNFQSDQKPAVVQKVSQHSFQLQETYCLEWRRAGASRAHMQLRNCVFPDLCNGECA